MIFFSVFKLFISICLLILAAYYGGHVTFDIAGKIIELHIAAVVFSILVMLYAYGFLKSVLRKISSALSGKPAYEKGVDYLQRAFSGILLKDRKLAAKSIEKAKKYLGDIPLLAWIEGQLMLANNDQHRAKAIFYELSSKEKDTALGAYSICNMAIKERSSSDAINAINSVLKIYPHAYELIFQAIVISLRDGNFIEAEKYLSSIKNTKKGKLVAAIVYSEKGRVLHDADLLKKAFKLAPELSENALHYADCLISDKEYRSARKVLMQAFKCVHLHKLYEKYISCGKNLSNSDILKLAEKIMDEVPNSWLTHFEFANLALKNDMQQLAFQHLLIAYEKEQYNFIADKIEEIVRNIGNTPQNIVNISSLPELINAKPVRFVWKCRHCGSESDVWMPICAHCDWIGEYVYEENCTINSNQNNLISFL